MKKIKVTMSLGLDNVTVDIFFAWLNDYFQHQITPDLNVYTIDGVQYTLDWQDAPLTPSLPFTKYVQGYHWPEPEQDEISPLVFGRMRKIPVMRPTPDIVDDLIAIRVLMRSVNELYVFITSDYPPLGALLTDLQQTSAHFFKGASIDIHKVERANIISAHSMSREDTVERLALAQKTKEVHDNSDLPYKKIIKITGFDYGKNSDSSIALLNKALRQLKELEINDPQHLLPDIRARREVIDKKIIAPH